MDYLRENLAALLEQRTMNATTLSAATGVPQPTIHRILTGESKDPRTSTIKPLADYFGIPVETLRSAYLGATLESAQQPTEHPGNITSRNFAKLAGERERKFLNELEKLLDKDIDYHVLHNFSGYRFDYASSRVTAEFKVLPVRSREHPFFKQAAPTARIDTLSVTRTLWRMSCAKLLTSVIDPDRYYLIFLDTVAFDANVNIQQAASPMGKVVLEARLHGIYAYWCGPQDAAQIVAAVERGSPPPEFSDTDEDEWQSPDGEGEL